MGRKPRDSKGSRGFRRTEYDTNRSYWKKDLDSRAVLNTRATKDAVQPLIQELNRQIKRSRQ